MVDKKYVQVLYIGGAQSSECEAEKQLKKLQVLYEQNFRYVTRYAFCCGALSVCEGRVPAEGEDLSWEEQLERGLFMLPGMKSHPEYYKNSMLINHICESLEKQKNPIESENGIAFCCDWDQKIYAASIEAYRRGRAEVEEIWRNPEP